jgi:heme oxygenase
LKTLLQNLRDTTAALHEAMEREVAIADPALDLDAYGEILLGFHGFYSAIEPILPAYGDDPADWITGDRRKTAWLAADLEALRIAPGQSLSPEHVEVPAYRGSEDAPVQLGAMYVLEGATLGGQHVLKHVLPRLGIGPDTGGRFFEGYGDRTANMWRSFLAEMERWVVTPVDRDRAVRAACDTFERFLHWMSSRRSARPR